MFDDDVWRYLPIGPFATPILGVVGLGLLFAVSLRAGPRMQRLAVFMLIATTLAIVYATMRDGVDTRGPHLSLRPGAGIRSGLENVNRALGVIIVLGNIAVFLPFGWLVAVRVLYDPSCGALAAVLRGTAAGFALSLVIEVTQLFVGRVTDVDDLLLNTAGALLGASIGAALSVSRRRSGDASACHEPGGSTHA